MEHLLKNHIKRKTNPELFNLKKYKTINVKKLAAGCYNINYLVKINSKHYVFRINVHRDAFEGGNLEKEFATLKKLNGFHSPKVFLLDKKFKHPLIVEEFIKGNKISKLSNSLVKKIAKALAEIHLAFSSKKRKPKSIKNKYISRFNKRLKLIRKNKKMFDTLSAYANKAKKYLDKKDLFFQKHAKNVFSHGDMHCGNIILRNGKVFFTDWENSKFDDPAFDIVAFFYESENLQYFNEKNSISAAHKRLFLKEYLKINPDKHLRGKIDIIYPLRWLSDTLWLACRIVDYEDIPKGLRGKLKEEYLTLYKFNLTKLKQMWK